MPYFLKMCRRDAESAEQRASSTRHDDAGDHPALRSLSEHYLPLRRKDAKDAKR
jgi:hypothetical protein